MRNFALEKDEKERNRSALPCSLGGIDGTHHFEGHMITFLSSGLLKMLMAIDKVSLQLVWRTLETVLCMSMGTINWLHLKIH